MRTKAKNMAILVLTSMMIVICISMTASVVAQSAPSPFMIYGYVFYEDGSECNNPCISLTNLNTSKGWDADTNASCNYYLIMLANGTNINASEVLWFNATSSDGSQSNTTLHNVTSEEIVDGGWFNFTVTLFVLIHPTYDKADTNQDCEISMIELLTAIGWWKHGTYPDYGMIELLTSIGRWKAGSYC